jgi:hypothetical protein
VLPAAAGAGYLAKTRHRERAPIRTAPVCRHTRPETQTLCARPTGTNCLLDTARQRARQRAAERRAHPIFFMISDCLRSGCCSLIFSRSAIDLGTPTCVRLPAT